MDRLRRTLNWLGYKLRRIDDNVSKQLTAVVDDVAKSQRKTATKEHTDKDLEEDMWTVVGFNWKKTEAGMGSRRACTRPKDQ